MISLQTFSETDIPQLMAWVNRPGASDTWASRTYPYPLSESVVLKHLKRTLSSPPELMIFKIVITESEQTIGHVELDKFDHVTGSVRISRLFIDPRFRSKGIAKMAVKNLLKLCFDKFQTNRIEILAVESNKAALALYRKIVFKDEGFLRENMLISQHRESSYLMSFLKAEYGTLDRQRLFSHR